jgi:hypothetical protein
MAPKPRMDRKGETKMLTKNSKTLEELQANNELEAFLTAENRAEIVQHNAWDKYIQEGRIQAWKKAREAYDNTMEEVYRTVEIESYKDYEKEYDKALQELLGVTIAYETDERGQIWRVINGPGWENKKTDPDFTFHFDTVDDGAPF